MIETSVEIAWLGGINKLGGVVFYVLMYVLVYSVVLFYLEKMKLIKPDTIATSITYPYIQPLGPLVIDGLGKLVPIFRDLFTELESFFENLSQKVPQSKASM